MTEKFYIPSMILIVALKLIVDINGSFHFSRNLKIVQSMHTFSDVEIIN